MPRGGFGEAFANRLRDARLAARGGLGLGPQEIADAIGLSQATVSDYERGRRRPNLTTLLALARLLGVSADWLLTGDDAPAGSVAGAAQAGAGPAVAQGGSPRPGLLDSSLVDLLGLSRLSYLGEAGLLGTDMPAGSGTGQTPAAELTDAAEHGLRTAEQRTAYRAVARLTPRSDLAVSREMSSGAESVILYTGPATGGLAPGDLLLVGSREPGRPGMHVVALTEVGSATATGSSVFAVAPPGGSVPPGATRHGTVLAILRRVD